MAPYHEQFAIYEEKKEEPTFQIYQDTLQTESSVVLKKAHETKKIEVKQTTEVKVTVEREKPALEVNPIVQNVAEPYRPALQEIKEDKLYDALLTEEGPMSLDNSLVSTGSGKKGSRSKRESFKISRSNFYDIDEYRADIYHYFKSVEVCTVHLSTLIHLNNNFY